MISRILKKPIEHKKSFFLFGPRGTGKTVWVKTHLENSLYIDLLNMEIYTQLIADPHRINDFIEKSYRD